jgi:hypothetical protein
VPAGAAPAQHSSLSLLLPRCCCPATGFTQILTPRKLFVLPSKVSVFPSNAISLEEVSPRFDDVKGSIHLDVSMVLLQLMKP